MSTDAPNVETAVDDGSTGSLHTPGASDAFHLLLYHCLVHQRMGSDRLSSKALTYLAPLSLALGVSAPTAAQLTAKAPEVWARLEAFTRAHRYEATCPSDKEVRFHGRPGRFQKCRRPEHKMRHPSPQYCLRPQGVDQYGT